MSALQTAAPVAVAVLAARSAADIPLACGVVDVATGDVVLFQPDVSRPGVLPLVIGRAYRSSWRAGRWFGRSWASCFDQRLQVTAGRVTGIFADGRILSWPVTPGHDPAGKPDTGPPWRLERVAGDAFTVTDPQAGLVWRFERHRARQDEFPLVGVTDRAGHRIGFGFTEAGRPAWITHSGGYRIGVVMDGERIVALTQDDVTLVRYCYNPAGDLAAVVDRAERALPFRYDEEGRLTGFQDWTGESHQYSYDDQGRCVAGAGHDGALAASFAYGDRVTWYTDAAGAVTIYQLDEASRVAAVTDPLGHVNHFWHDEAGRLVARTDPLGHLSKYDYDERGNLACVTRPDGGRVRAGYDAANLPVRLDGPDGASWRQEYDPRGNLIRRTAPDGAVTSFGYDEHGHLTSVTDPLGRVTLVECDAAGLPTVLTGPDGGITRYTRDPFGLVTAVTGPDGGRTEFRRDHALRLTAVVRAGLTREYAYDAAGRLVAETDENGAVTRYAYDAAGRLVSRVNAEGQEVTCGYDELGRLVRREADGLVTTFGYDRAGRLVRASHPGAEVRLSRDPLGRVTAETCDERTVWSEYDDAGRRVRRVTPGGARCRWEYDAAGKPLRLDADGQVLGFGYDECGREIRRDLPGGLILAQAWDLAGRLTSQVLTVGSDGERVLARRTYAYQADGRLADVDDLLTGPRRLTLDAAGRITAVGGPGWAERYGYDQAGRLSSARWTAPPPFAADGWLAADVQGSRDRNGTLVTRAGSISYRHDEGGRVILRQRAQAGRVPQTWTFRWDGDDRLTAVTTPDGATWRYRYDPLGRRIGKQRLDPVDPLGPSGTVAQESAYTWDGPVLAEEITGPQRVTWVYEPGTATALTQDAGGRFCAVITDPDGAPAELTGADGTVAGYQQHTVWGGTLWHPDGASTSLRLPGQYYDPETGLHYHLGRYYDPVTGSYLTPDPGRGPADRPPCPGDATDPEEPGILNRPMGLCDLPGS